MNDKTITDSLREAVLDAVNSVKFDGAEEEGGVIVRFEDTFKFIKVENQYTNTARSLCLYIPNRAEFGEKVVSYLIQNNAKMFSSFHTHPGSSVKFSTTDITHLFKGFKNNFIFSPYSRQLSLTTFADNWVYFDNINYDIPNAFLKSETGKVCSDVCDNHDKKISDLIPEIFSYGK